MSNNILESTRLRYRPLTAGDESYFEELDGDPDVRYYLPGGAQSKVETQNRIKHFLDYSIKHALPCMMIFEKSTDNFVGRSRFRQLSEKQIEIHFLLHKKYWGKGYGSEILGTLIQWLKQHLNCSEIICLTAVEHIASQRVLEKCGLQRFKNETVKGIDCCFYKLQL